MNVVLFLETRNQYNEILIGVLTPFIREGLNSIYKEAMKVADESNSNNNVLEIFQAMLKGVEKWNQDMIMKETQRIKRSSNTDEYFDNLVKAVIKSNIVLLTCTNTISNYIGQTFYNNFKTETLIHRCYIESAKDMYNNPFLFDHDASPQEIKKCQVMINQIVEKCIQRAINKVLPIASILKEYLMNSINIIPEPPKVELVNQFGQQYVPPNPYQTNFGFNPVANMPLQHQLFNVNNNRPVDPIKSAGKDKKSEKFDKNVWNPDQATKPVEIDSKLNKEIMSIINSGEKEKSDHDKVKQLMVLDRAITSIASASMKDHQSEPYLPVHMMDDRSPKKKALQQGLVNINFDDHTTDNQQHTTSIKIDMSPITNKITRRHTKKIEETDIDPDQINDFVEEYGTARNDRPSNTNNRLSGKFLY